LPALDTPSDPKRGFLRRFGPEPTANPRITSLGKEVLLARLATSRHSFNPEALSQIALIVDEVCKELATEGSHNPYLSATAGRTLVSAQSQWCALQIKQLLLRVLRNEISVRRRKKCGAPAKM
jgi:hypothetical protein